MTRPLGPFPLPPICKAPGPRGIDGLTEGPPAQLPRPSCDGCELPKAAPCLVRPPTCLGDACSCYGKPEPSRALPMSQCGDHDLRLKHEHVYFIFLLPEGPSSRTGSPLGPPILSEASCAARPPGITQICPLEAETVANAIWVSLCLCCIPGQACWPATTCHSR